MAGIQSLYAGLKMLAGAEGKLVLGQKQMLTILERRCKSISQQSVKDIGEILKHYENPRAVVNYAVTDTAANARVVIQDGEKALATFRVEMENFGKQQGWGAGFASIKSDLSVGADEFVRLNASGSLRQVPNVENIGIAASIKEGVVEAHYNLDELVTLDGKIDYKKAIEKIKELAPESEREDLIKLLNKGMAKKDTMVAKFFNKICSMADGTYEPISKHQAKNIPVDRKSVKAKELDLNSFKKISKEFTAEEREAFKKIMKYDVKKA